MGREPLSKVFISYARSTEAVAHRIAEALRAVGYDVWRDDELPAHRAYGDVIEEHLKAAKAVVVLWSAEAVKSQWVRSEANRARQDHKLVQLRLDGADLPMPFDQVQCADLVGWGGDLDAPGWRKVVASVADLAGKKSLATAPVAEFPPPMPSKPSIAVMPFANLSSDPEQDYFADGMMDEIVTALTRCKSIFVIGSGSTLSLQGKPVGAQEVARLLGVRYVLEGSVRRAANRVRIAVKLIDAADGAQIWADRFDDSLEDVFALQDKVALSVAGVIEPAVRDAEIRRATTRPTSNMSSYDLYLRALPLFRTFRKAQMSRALDLLDRAIDLDPSFAIALAVAATCHMQVISYGWSDDLEGHRLRGIERAERALGIGGDDAQVLAQVAAALRGLDRTLDRPMAIIDRAVALNPGSSQVWFTSGLIRAVAGEPEAALEHLGTASRLSPHSFMADASHAWMAIARFEQHRFEEALALSRDTAYRFPLWYAVEAALHAYLGRMREAREALSAYQAASSSPIEETADAWFRDEAHRKLFLDGVGLAEGKTSSTHPAAESSPSD